MRTGKVLFVGCVLFCLLNVALVIVGTWPWVLANAAAALICAYAAYRLARVVYGEAER